MKEYSLNKREKENGVTEGAGFCISKSEDTGLPQLWKNWWYPQESYLANYPDTSKNKWRGWGWGVQSVEEITGEVLGTVYSVKGMQYVDLDNYMV